MSVLPDPMTGPVTGPVGGPVAGVVPPAIDPFARTVDGTYRDDLVEVRAQRGPTPYRRGKGTVRTASFDVTHRGSRVEVVHRVPPEAVDDDLAGRLAHELFGPGWLRGTDLFERVFTGVVLTSASTVGSGWELFYRQTSRRIDEVLAGPDPEPSGYSPGSGHGTIADYAPVYGRAERLVGEGSVLELGCCFGFLSLRLAAAGRRVTASDVNAGSVALLAHMAPRLGVGLVVCAADASAYPAPDRAFDDVVLVHLLEHVDAAVGWRILGEAVRLARRRVIVAVPLEDVADETWGHVRTVSVADLDTWGRDWSARAGLRHEVREDHGGWLVLDRG